MRGKEPLRDASGGGALGRGAEPHPAGTIFAPLFSGRERSDWRAAISQRAFQPDVSGEPRRAGIRAAAPAVWQQGQNRARYGTRISRALETARCLRAGSKGLAVLR